MTQKEMYDFIGKLALVLYSQKTKISLTSLNSILKDQDKVLEYKHWKKKDAVIHHAIAYTYTDKNGKLPWV